MIKNSDLIACPYCDTLQKKASLTKGQISCCACCGSVLQKYASDINKSFILSIAALILFLIANLFPFITLEIYNDTNTISIFSSVLALYHNGFTALSIAVFLFIIIFPNIYLLAIITVIASFKYHFFPNLKRRILLHIERLLSWNMIEVYLIGVIVTLVKITQLASIRFNSGFWVFCLLILCSLLTNYYFDINNHLFDLENEENEHEIS